MCLPQSMSSSKNCGTKGSLQVANSPGRCFRCLGSHSLNPARTKKPYHAWSTGALAVFSLSNKKSFELSLGHSHECFLQAFWKSWQWICNANSPQVPDTGFVHIQCGKKWKTTCVCKNQDWNCTENNGVLSKLLSRVWVSVVFISLLTNSGIGSVPASAIEGLACNSIHISTVANIAQ